MRTPRPRLIGIDFDNTIVCYDDLFYRLALVRSLIPAETPPTKEAIRDVLRADGREDDWTELQGEVYGPGLRLARPFDGALDFLSGCARSGTPVVIVSHRTRTPYIGPPHDLHAFARDWLAAHGFTMPGPAGLTDDMVHFEPTKAAKLTRIRLCGCSHFIDDLPEFLLDPAFPAGVRRLLFDPNGSGAAVPSDLHRIHHWHEAAALVGLL